MLQQHPWLQIHKQWRSKKSFPSLKWEKKINSNFPHDLPNTQHNRYFPGHKVDLYCGSIAYFNAFIDRINNREISDLRDINWKILKCHSEGGGGVECLFASLREQLKVKMGTRFRFPISISLSLSPPAYPKSKSVYDKKLYSIWCPMTTTTHSRGEKQEKASFSNEIENFFFCWIWICTKYVAWIFEVEMNINENWSRYMNLWNLMFPSLVRLQFIYFT